MTTYRLFPSTSGPSSPVSYSGNILTGVLFKVTQGGMWFTGYYKWVSAGEDVTARKFALWQITGNGTGVHIPAADVTSGTLTANAWNFVALSTPIQLAIGTAYNATTGWSAVSGHGFSDSDTSGAGTGATDSYGSGGHTAGITQGPLFAFSDNANGGTKGEPYGTSQGVFGVGGTDATVTMAATGSNAGNFWMDVQVSDTAPAGYTGSYRLWPNKSDANSVTTADAAVNYDVATEFALSQACALNKIWYYSPPGVTQLATAASIWSVTGGGLTGTQVATASSPSWSGAAGSKWVSVSFAGVTLPAGKYKASVYNGAGSPAAWNAKDANSDYWRNGDGGSGITNGPLSAPQLSAASTAYNYNGNAGGTPPYSDGTTLAGQSTFSQGPPDGYPYLVALVATPTAGSTQNYWVDVEVTLAPVLGVAAITSAGALAASAAICATAAPAAAGSLAALAAQPAGATLAAAGTITAKAVQSATASPAAAGALSASAGGTVAGIATATGAGSVTARGTVVAPVVFARAIASGRAPASAVPGTGTAATAIPGGQP